MGHLSGRRKESLGNSRLPSLQPVHPVLVKQFCPLIPFPYAPSRPPLALSCVHPILGLAVLDFPLVPPQPVEPIREVPLSSAPARAHNSIAVAFE